MGRKTANIQEALAKKMDVIFKSDFPVGTGGLLDSETFEQWTFGLNN